MNRKGHTFTIDNHEQIHRDIEDLPEFPASRSAVLRFGDIILEGVNATHHSSTA